MWEFNNKNIFFKATFIDTDTKNRITELGGNIVKLKSPFSRIDVIVYSDEIALKKTNKTLDNALSKQKDIDITYITLTKLQLSIGLDDSLPFALWEQLPKFDPWSGDKINPSRYNNALIKKGNQKWLQ